MAYLNTKR